MIIGIDISSIVYGTGVSNYTLNLVSNLIKIDKKNSYKLFFSSFRLPLPPAITKLVKAPNVKIYHYRLPLSLLQFFWNQLRILPIELFIGKCDIFHTSDWTQPPTIHAKTITTIHDLVPLLYPQWSHPKITSVHQRKLTLASKHCHHFIAVSQNTKNDFQKLFPQIPDHQITVIYEAAEQKYDQFLKLSPARRQQKIQSLRRIYDLRFYFLAQATREPRKNLTRLIKAFNLFRQKYPQSQVELAISGKYGWGQDILHLKHPWIKVLGYIPEKDIVTLHAAAICLVYPSFYEGFGLPVIKSMKVGTPVITSRTSSLPEICGPAAILVDPNSTKELANSIEQIARNPNLRQKLSRLGLKQSRQFNWGKTATQTLKIYQQLC